MSVDVLTVSSKERIVLPVPVRKALSTVVGKKMELPKEDEFRKWLDDAQEWAAQSGLVEDDVQAIISAVRARKRP